MIDDSMFVPDLSRYDEILYQDGKPINDINFVQHERAEIASLLGQNVLMNESFEPPISGGSEDEAFDSIIPKEVQSLDEFYSYQDYLENLNK